MLPAILTALYPPAVPGTGLGTKKDMGIGSPRALGPGSVFLAVGMFERFLEGCLKEWL